MHHLTLVRQFNFTIIAATSSAPFTPSSPILILPFQLLLHLHHLHLVHQFYFYHFSCYFICTIYTLFTNFNFTISAATSSAPSTPCSPILFLPFQLLLHLHHLHLVHQFWVGRSHLHCGQHPDLHSFGIKNDTPNLLKRQLERCFTWCKRSPSELSGLKQKSLWIASIEIIVYT